MIHAIATTVIPFAAETAEEDSGTFLVSPGIGLMIWVLLTVGITFLILRAQRVSVLAGSLKRSSAVRT